MVMAATGCTKHRNLTQPPRGLQRAVRRRGLHFPGLLQQPLSWVAAVLLVSTICLLGIPLDSQGAQANPIGAAADTSASEDSAPVVPILFPLENRIAWTDTFGAARSGGRTHAGNDLMAPKMTPILAVVDGTLDWMNTTGKLSSYNNLPYYNILLRGDDGNDYFYIHLNNDTPGTDDGLGGVENAYAPGLTNGRHVEKGQVIGYVGDSGNAEDVASHLHFEIHLGGYVAAGSGQSRTPSAIDPYPSLMAAPTLAEWQAGGTSTTDPGTTPGSTATTSTTTTTLPPATTTTSTTTTTATPSTTSTVRPTTTITIKPTTTTTVSSGTDVPGYTDVETTDWFYDDFAMAKAAGVVVPSADERFRPYSKVSRALFAVYLVRAMAPGELRDLTSTGGAGEAGTFSDVSTSHWAYAEIEIAARLHLVQGTGDGSTFSPDALVTRAQMAAMMCRALRVEPSVALAASDPTGYAQFADVPRGYWALGSIGTVQSLGLMCGDDVGCFRPLENTTRAQAITVMARLMRLLEGGSES